MSRTLLLVDDEENILSALYRVLRRDGYQILRASSGQQGLELLSQHDVGVIISDQRMPGMTGIEFLRMARKSYPDTVRIVLSGYTELNAVTEAINQGAVYKFLTKPWDDTELRAHAKEAFELYVLKVEGNRLSGELQQKNQSLQDFNFDLERCVEEKTQELSRKISALQIAQEVLEHLPIGVIGIAEDGLIAVANSAAHALLGLEPASLLGNWMGEALPEPLIRFLDENRQSESSPQCISLETGQVFEARVGQLGRQSRSQGAIVMLCPRGSGEQQTRMMAGAE